MIGFPTPTPWTTYRFHGGQISIRHDAVSGGEIAKIRSDKTDPIKYATDLANARLMVESVNSHATLVERVKVLTEILGRVLIHSTQETHGVHLVNALKDAAEAVRGEK